LILIGTAVVPQCIRYSASSFNTMGK
jgi:hypothetical protein